MTDYNKNVEVNLVTTPQENRTPIVGLRQEQPKAPVWAIGIQQAFEKLIKATVQNVALNRHQQDESNQSQSQVQVRELEQERQWSLSAHPQDRLHIIHKFLKLKPPRYNGVNPSIDSYQFTDQIKRIGKMLGCTKNILIE